jgi:hypothetical protein
LNSDGDPALRPTDFRFIEIEHEGCSQKQGSQQAKAAAIAKRFSFQQS